MLVSSFFHVSTLFSLTLLFIQPHRQKSNGVWFGGLDSCISVTIGNVTCVHRIFLHVDHLITSQNIYIWITLCTLASRVAVYSSLV